MAKKFDGHAYVQNWDKKMAPIMLGVIIVSIALVVWLNKATKPDCTTHEYLFCGTPLQDGQKDVGDEDHGGGHGAPAHGAEGGHPATEH